VPLLGNVWHQKIVLILCKISGEQRGKAIPETSGWFFVSYKEESLQTTSVSFEDAALLLSVFLG